MHVALWNSVIEWYKYLEEGPFFFPSHKHVLQLGYVKPKNRLWGILLKVSQTALESNSLFNPEYKKCSKKQLYSWLIMNWTKGSPVNLMSQIKFYWEAWEIKEKPLLSLNWHDEDLLLYWFTWQVTQLQLRSASTCLSGCPVLRGSGKC